MSATCHTRASRKAMVRNAALIVLFALPSTPVLGQTLIGSWALDETSGTAAADSSGNGNNAAFNSGSPSWTSGIVGNSVNFPGGSTNYFNTAALDELAGANGLTVSGWINPDTNASFRGILVTRLAQTSFGGAAGNWGLNHEGDSIDARVQSSTTGSNGLNTAAGSVLTNQWTHVTMTWNQSDGARNIYLNGQLAISDTVSAGTTWTNGGVWQIGNDTCCTSRVFDGPLDELAVWSGALSTTQVQQVHSAGLNNVSVKDALSAGPTLGAIQQGLVGSWNMDQSAGTAAAGDSINGNHAVLSGATPSTAWVSGQAGRALELDGSNDQAIISAIPQINNSNEMTISLWVRNDGGNEGYEGIFQHRSADDSNQQGLMTPSNSTVAAGNPANDVMGRIGGTASIITTADNAIPTDGSWTHIVQTYKAGQIHEIYIDGVLAAGGPTAANVPIISDGAWRFGNDACCANRFFDGGIDDAGLWNRALGPEEIQAVRQAGLDGISHTRAFVPENGPLQQGAVGHWTFDQARFHATANDSLGGIDAALSSMDTGSAWVGGQIGGALQFDGSDDQAVISGVMATQLNTALNGSDALTMSLWVRSDGQNNNNEGLFEHRSANNSNLTGFNTPSAGTDNFDFRINGNSLMTNDNTLADGQWQHIVGVWESDERYEIWIDGALTESRNPTSGTLIADGDWRFGNDTCCGNRFFEGALDDVALWDRALSEEEIQALYADGLQGLNFQQAITPIQPQVIPEPSGLLLWLFIGLAFFGSVLQARRLARY